MAFGGGCDDNRPLGEEVGVSAKAVLSTASENVAESDEKSTVEDEERPLSINGPVLPVSLKWNSGGKGEMVSADSLSVEVTNPSILDYFVSVDFHATGLGILKRTAKFGEWDLSAGENVAAEIPADRMPIQVKDSVAQGRIVVSLTHQIPGTNEPRTVTYVSTVIHYNHQEGYKKINLFDNQVLLERFGGKLVEIPHEEAKMSTMLGRIIQEDGTFRDVTPQDKELAVKNEKGEDVGISGGVSIGIVNIDDLPGVTR